MLIKTIILSLTISFFQIATAADNSRINTVDITSQVIDTLLVSTFDGNFKVKRGDAYDESRDPVMQKEGPESHSPEHGYFAVPLVVIGILGVLLFFIRNE